MLGVVTVVTLTYKKFELLFNAIDSVLIQDYSQIEYIISDDGSPDFPKDNILNYIDAKRNANIVSVKIITNKQNLGTVKNINEAYRHATGDIIIPLSADDAFYDSSVVSQIVKTYEERNCNALVVGRAVVDKNNSFIKTVPNIKERKILEKHKNNRYQYQLFITGCAFEAYSGCVLSLKRDFIESWGYFDEKYTLLEDGPFFAKYLWDNYLECNFDIIGLNYRNDGVSGANKHPLLLKDDELFMKTDKVAHINELTFINREVVKFSSVLHSNGSLLAILSHPLGCLLKVYYSMRRIL